MTDLALSQTKAFERAKLIRWGVLTTLLSGGAAAIVGVFSAPITINYLGKDLYAIWVLISSFFLWMQLFDFGLLNGLTNALTEALGRDDYRSAQSYVSTAFAILIGISLICLGPTIYLSLNIPWEKVINVTDPEYGLAFRKGLCAMGVNYLLILPFTLFGRILVACQRYYLLRVVNFVSYLLSLIALIMGVYFRFKILPLLIFVTLAPSLWYFVCSIACFKKISWAKISWATIEMKALKRILQSSIPLLIFQLLNMLINEILPIVIASMATLRFVADYTITWKVQLYVSSLLIGVASAYSAGFRDAYERKETGWIIAHVKKLVFVQMGLLLAACAPLLLAGDDFITTWIRMPLDEPLGTSGWIIVSLCLVMTVLQSTLSSVLIALDKIVPQIIFRLFSGICLFAGLGFAVSRFGIKGVYLSILVSVIIPLLWTVVSLRRIVKLQMQH